MPEADNHPNDYFKSRKNSGIHFKYPFQGWRVLYFKLLHFLELLKIEMFTDHKYRKQLQNPTRHFFNRYYSKEKIWIQDYLYNIREFIALTKGQQPDAEVFIVAMPTFFAVGRPEDFQEKLDLPDESIPMQNRAYLADNQESRFLFTMYYHHTILFSELLEKNAPLMGFNLLLGYPIFSDFSFKERSKFFYDEIHLTNEGNLLLAKQLAQQLFLYSEKFQSYRNK